MFGTNTLDFLQLVAWYHRTNFTLRRGSKVCNALLLVDVGVCHVHILFYKQ